MTVSSTTTKASYSGNGVTTVFAVPFYFLLNADLLVILRSAGGVETTQLLGTNYTVTGAGNEAGGSVTMIVAPASGTTLTILRNAPATQDTDLLPNDRLPAESLETALDKLTMLVQQLEEDSARSLKIAVTDSAISSSLPTSGQRANKFLSFDASGNPVANAYSGPFVGFEEFQTATAGQTVFNLTTISYNPGANNLQVFIDGVNQYSGTSYIETSPTRVTFTQGLHVGAVVKFTTVQTQTSSVTDSASVFFKQIGSGSVSRNVQTKLQESISSKDFGAVGDGVSDDTTALANFFNACAGKRGRLVAGNYLVTLGNGIGPLFIPSDCLIEGDGIGVSTITVKANSTLPSSILRGVDCSNSILRNFTLTYATQSATPPNPDDYFIGIALVRPNDVLVEGIEITNCKGAGIRLIDNTGPVKAHGNKISTVEGCGIFVSWDARIGDNPNLISIKQNNISNVKYNVLGSSSVTTADKGIYVVGFTDLGNTWANPYYFTNVQIDENRLLDIFDYGICVQACKGVSISNNTLRNAWTGSLTRNIGILLTELCVDCTVTGNTVTGFAFYGIGVDTTTNTITHGGHSVAGNSCSYNKRGINVQSSPATVTGNSCEFNTEFGIALSQEQNCVVSGNTVSRNTGYGIGISGTSGTVSKNIVVTGNLIRDNSNEGLDLNGCEDVVITGNLFDNNDAGVYAIRIVASPPSVPSPVRTIVNSTNIFRDFTTLLNASNVGTSIQIPFVAAPTTLESGWTLNGVYEQWNATAQAGSNRTSSLTTAIANGIYVGQRVIIADVGGGSDRIILANGANTLLAGGTNATFTANGLMELIWTGSIWKELCRTF